MNENEIKEMYPMIKDYIIDMNGRVIKIDSIVLAEKPTSLQHFIRNEKANERWYYIEFV